MSRVTLCTLRERRAAACPITALTAYDASFARVLDQNDIDVVLVGDSLGMVIQGHDDPLRVTLDHLVYHTAAVARAASRMMVMADLPFLADASSAVAIEAAGALLRAGAQVVKLECRTPAHAEIVAALTRCGIPVCAHIGLTPQSVHLLGGFRQQGREPDDANALVELQSALQAAGAVMLLWEAIPDLLARRLSESAQVPTIGIGAGSASDGQVLVLHDVIGLSSRAPRFARCFLDGVNAGTIDQAVAAYAAAVRSRAFPLESTPSSSSRGA
ncbi:MAG: 3-methyl-2-oxobutanoate hydroxymethyltransferase [Thioalkalivibrionaceae bacterium]